MKKIYIYMLVVLATTSNSLLKAQGLSVGPDTYAKFDSWQALWQDMRNNNLQDQQIFQMGNDILSKFYQSGQYIKQPMGGPVSLNTVTSWFHIPDTQQHWTQAVTQAYQYLHQAASNRQGVSPDTIATISGFLNQYTNWSELVAGARKNNASREAIAGIGNNILRIHDNEGLVLAGNNNEPIPLEVVLSWEKSNPDDWSRAVNDAYTQLRSWWNNKGQGSTKAPLEQSLASSWVAPEELAESTQQQLTAQATSPLTASVALKQLPKAELARLVATKQAQEIAKKAYAGDHSEIGRSIHAFSQALDKNSIAYNKPGSFVLREQEQLFRMIYALAQEDVGAYDKVQQEMEGYLRGRTTQMRDNPNLITQFMFGKDNSRIQRLVNLEHIIKVINGIINNPSYPWKNKNVRKQFIANNNLLLAIIQKRLAAFNTTPKPTQNKQGVESRRTQLFDAIRGVDNDHQALGSLTPDDVVSLIYIAGGLQAGRIADFKNGINKLNSSLLGTIGAAFRAITRGWTGGLSSDRSRAIKRAYEWISKQAQSKNIEFKKALEPLTQKLKDLRIIK